MGLYQTEPPRYGLEVNGFGELESELRIGFGLRIAVDFLLRSFVQPCILRA